MKPTPAIDTLFGYTGRAYDEETGLQNNLNRWYDSTTGTWPSPDPIGIDAGDPNFYRYVGNQSTTLIDPDGLQPPYSGTVVVLKTLDDAPDMEFTTKIMIGAGAMIRQCFGGASAQYFVDAKVRSHLEWARKKENGEVVIAQIPEWITDIETGGVGRGKKILDVIGELVERGLKREAAEKLVRETAEKASKSGDDIVEECQSLVRKKPGPAEFPDRPPASPAVDGSPYSPREVNKRQSELRRQLGVEPDPNVPIPTQPPGHNLKSKHGAKKGTPHSTRERNVNPNEEHSRRPKGGLGNH